MAATSHIRSLGVPCSQYIDDRHIGQLSSRPGSALEFSDLELAEAAKFISASTLVYLGYFIGLTKSSLLPSRTVRFLGFMVDSERQAFIIPEDKKEKFADLREVILSSRTASAKTLQRLTGKISSFCIAVPAALLYAREVFHAASGYEKSSRQIKISGSLKKEIEFWRFLDS